jgi:ferredoxin, 2Fe-2S
MKILATDRDGTVHEIEGIDGWQLMELLRDAGMPIRAECGGSCACATCHVYIDPEWVGRLEEKQPEETDMLDLAFDVQENSRLSCQIIMRPELDGLKLTIAPD